MVNPGLEIPQSLLVAGLLGSFRNSIMGVEIFTSDNPFFEYTLEGILIALSYDYSVDLQCHLKSIKISHSQVPESNRVLSF